MKRKLFVSLATLAIVANAWCQVGTRFLSNGIAFNITSTSPATVAVVSNNPSYSGSITIPATVDYSGTNYAVTAIGHYAFFDCGNLTSVIIPSSVTAIGVKAFFACGSLTSVIIPSSVTAIGFEAFARCSGLTSVIIPSLVKSIDEAAFSECSGLTSVSILSGVTSIGRSAFDGCIKLSSVNIPSSVTTIGQSAFYGCSGLISVSIPSSVTSIGDDAFSKCSGLTSVSILSGVTTIGSNAFDGCSGLISVSIPSSVTTIGQSAFARCSGLISVSIPSSVTAIGSYAFDRCSALSSITAEAAVPVNLSNAYTVFNNVSKNTCVLRVPFGSLAAYRAANQWKDFTNVVEMDPITSLCSSFRNTTLSNLRSSIACYSLVKATSYEWLFVNGTDTLRATTTSADTTFIPGKAGLKFGTAYSVSIRAKLGDSWSAPGDAFTITTPATRATTLAATYRYASMKDWNSLFRAHYMGGATRYEFVFTDKTTGEVLTYLSKNHAMCFKSLAGAQAGHTYLLKIRPWYYQSAGSFGTSFSITAPK